MITSVNNNCRPLTNVQRLVRRHLFQVRLACQDPELTGLLAMTFRPSRNSGSFLGQTLQRIGSATLMVLSYQPIERSNRLELHLSGYRASPNRDGSVTYGGEGNCRFHFEGSRVSRRNARGRSLDASRNPQLVRVLLQLDESCKRQLERGVVNSKPPMFPRIMLGFAPNQPPHFEDSPTLRAIAAQELNVPVDQLGANGNFILQRYLDDLWQRQWLQPNTSANPTDKLLIDAELCTQAGRALEIFEDFSELMGAPIWNPARDVELLQVSNPARTVLGHYAVDMTQNFDQEVTDEQLLQLETAMRKAIGPLHANFTQEEIFDGLTNPSVRLCAAEAGLSQLRAKLASHIRDCVSDRDLLTAARTPCRPLFASGACIAQVAVRPATLDRAVLEYGEDDLGRRVHVIVGAGLAMR